MNEASAAGFQELSAETDPIAAAAPKAVMLPLVNRKKGGVTTVDEVLEIS